MHDHDHSGHILAGSTLTLKYWLQVAKDDTDHGIGGGCASMNCGNDGADVGKTGRRYLL
jgi:hypothetical protein